MKKLTRAEIDFEKSRPSKYPVPKWVLFCDEMLTRGY